jgi:hypothetical protein
MATANVGFDSSDGAGDAEPGVRTMQMTGNAPVGRVIDARGCGTVYQRLSDLLAGQSQPPQHGGQTSDGVEEEPPILPGLEAY